MPSVRRISRSIACSHCICSAPAFVVNPSVKGTRRVAVVVTVASSTNRRSGGGSRLHHRVRVQRRRNDSYLSAKIADDSAYRYRGLWKWADEQECEGVDAFQILVQQPAHSCNDDDKSYEGGMRGLFTTDESHFEAGDYMLAIPFTAALLVRDSHADDVTNSFLSLILDADIRDGYSFWTAFCANEADSSRYWPYLDALPLRDGPHFDPTPDFWPDDDVRQLQVPKLIDETLRRKRDIDELVRLHTERQRQEGNASRRMSVADLQWAVWVVRTRGFTTLQRRPGESDIRSDDDEALRGDARTSDDQVRTRTFLIPIVDMVNHSDLPNAELEVVEVPEAYDESFFALRALSTILPDDEITLQYGTGLETSLDLLSKYGFMPPNGAAGDVDLDWELVNPQWTTTLQDDRESLAGIVRSDESTRRTILALRVALKERQQQSRD